jgi:hypothetical protein
MDDLLSGTAFLERAQDSLSWARRSIDINEGKGSSAYFSRLHHPLKGWSKPYPETTGYLIETLLRYQPVFPEMKWLVDHSIQCGHWLLSIQHASGAFPALYADTGKPSVFNTGQILFGLKALYELTQDQRWYTALERAAVWLLSKLDGRSQWSQHLYQKGYVPAYHTRIIWAMLEANQLLKNDHLEHTMANGLETFFEKYLDQHRIQDMGFAPGKPAFTHTVAYTLRGALESGAILNRNDLMEQFRPVWEKLEAIFRKHHTLPGTFDIEWNGNYRFKCLTGHAQMALALGRAAQVYDEPMYDRIGRAVLIDMLPHLHSNGGVAGSSPVWGPYMRFKYPNWAVKFLLDALLFFSSANESKPE